MAVKAMTVKRLIEALEQIEPDRKVVLSRDSEGNGFSFLNVLETGMFFQDRGFGAGGGKVYRDSGPEGDLAVILYPIQ